MHLEVLNPEAKSIFLKLRNFPEFYLVGGTALALQIAHRISVDFDLFSQKEIPEVLLSKIERIFSDCKIDILVNNKEELTILLNQIKTTFFNYPFPVISKLANFEGVKILIVSEIAAAKAYALGRRATYKDYIDLYFILSEKHCSLEQLITVSQQKYQDKFDPRLFLEQLIYLKDIKDTDIRFLKKPVSREKLETFFQEEVKKLNL